MVASGLHSNQISQETKYRTCHGTVFLSQSFFYQLPLKTSAHLNRVHWTIHIRGPSFVLAMASPLESTYGIWLIAFFLQTILYGMGILQAYLYFFWYSNDTLLVKTTVCVYVFRASTHCLESFQLSTLFGATYHHLINGFGNFPQLLLISLHSGTAQYLSAFIVQMRAKNPYFAHSIYALHKNDKILPFAIVVSSLAALGQVVVISRIPSFADIDQIKTTTIINCVASILCDTLVTGGLCWRLHISRTGIQATNNLLNYLIIFAINRGILTRITTILQIILFFARPNTFYFFAMIWLSSKLYMNNMLATLNTRQHAKRQYVPVNHIVLSSVTSHPRFNCTLPGAQSLTVSTEENGKSGDVKFML
ncbi:hypothetical protein FB451DRAFT_1226352 [Mycena latifolia]|nr:hypothetical protein FB451DRAFT_1226352 [Mycena latifolia]